MSQYSTRPVSQYSARQVSQYSARKPINNNATEWTLKIIVDVLKMLLLSLYFLEIGVRAVSFMRVHQNVFNLCAFTKTYLIYVSSLTYLIHVSSLTYLIYVSSLTYLIYVSSLTYLICEFTNVFNLCSGNKKRHGLPIKFRNFHQSDIRGEGGAVFDFP